MGVSFHMKNAAARDIVGFALVLMFFGLFVGEVNPLFFGRLDFGDSTRWFGSLAEGGQVGLLLLVGLVSTRRAALVEAPMAQIAAVALMVGFACLGACILLGDAAPGVGFGLAAIAFGIGQGSSYLVWVRSFTRRDADHVASIVVASTILSAALLAALSLVHDQAVFLMLVFSIVLACIALLPRGGSPASLSSNGEGPAAAAAAGNSPLNWERPDEVCSDHGVRGLRALLGSLLGTTWQSLFCLAAIGFSCGAIRVVSLQVPGSLAFMDIMFPFGYLLGSAVLMGLWAVGGVSFDFRSLYSVLFVITATGCVMLPLAGDQFQPILYCIVNSAFTLASICMLMTCWDVSRTLKMSPFAVFGFVCGGVYFSVVVGRWAGYAANGVAGGYGVVEMLIVSSLVVYVIALASISSALLRIRRGMLPQSQEKTPPGIAHIVSLSENEIRSSEIFARQFGLTPREVDVLVLLLEGRNATSIAKVLQLSPNTVRTHLKNVYSKMDVHNRHDLLALVGSLGVEHNERKAPS